jgi:non-ribosomal peptide synthetase component F
MAKNVNSILDFINENCRLYNYYGSIECTGAAIQNMITDNNNNIEFLPLGRPLSNVHVYLLDDYLQPIIPGVQTGEIVIGGNIWLN